MATKSELQERFESRLRELDGEIDKIEGRLKEAQGEAKVQLERNLRDLREQRAEAQVKADEIADASEDAWDDIKDGFEDAWHSLENSFRNALNKFKS